MALLTPHWALSTYLASPLTFIFLSKSERQSDIFLSCTSKFIQPLVINPSQMLFQFLDICYSSISLPSTKISILVPKSAVINYLKSGWLKSETCSLIVPEARSQESRCQQSHIPSESTRKEFTLAFPTFGWLLVIINILWFIPA